MLSEEVRIRLEQLNRGRLPDLPASAAQPTLAPLPFRSEPGATGESGATGGLPASALKRRSPQTNSTDFSLASLLPGDEVATTQGSHYSVREPLDRFWPEFPSYLERISVRLSEPDRPSRRPLRQQLAKAFPQRTLFLDLETCGLAGAPIFLVGLIRPTPDGLLLDQLLARHYAEEQSILTMLEERVASCDVLVTFNGRSFDWPMVQDRRNYHRLPVGRVDLPHVDLLIHARLAWRQQVPNCRLQTLERCLCRRSRQGDIPGSQIPAAYHEFVRTGDARQLSNILHHNALDLVTLAQLTMRMLGEGDSK